MEDQGGAGGVPLHGHDDKLHGHDGKARRRAPHAERSGADEEGHAVRAADTDEASRLDRVGGAPKKGPGPVREIPHEESGGSAGGRGRAS
ncbi:hypothetical protein AB0M92_19530 [Streptomyces sp. NPDC051582]|uniref:hypothetical protein n=1 Tax=Streptomyces sp. NPDC051582 TaxID=3155167 RepID=UPI00344A3C57